MKPDIKIKLNDKEYRLRNTLRAMIDIEDEIGIPITQVKDDIGVSMVSVFIKHTIRNAEGEKVTPEQWDALTEEIDALEIFEAFGKLMDDDKKKGRGGAAKNRK